MSRLHLTGYTDRPNYRSGDTVTFFVSSTNPATATARVVRLRHGDPTPGGPGIRQDELDIPALPDLDVHAQITDIGGYVEIPVDRDLHTPSGVSLHLFVWPTVPGMGPQTLAGSIDDATGEGWVVQLIDGCPQLTVTSADGDTSTVVRGGSMFPETWYSLAISQDASHAVRLDQRAVVNSTNSRLSPIVDLADSYGDVAQLGTRWFAVHGSLTFAATAAARDGRTRSRDHFNGKIDSPTLTHGALDNTDLEALRAGEALDESRYLARWDFGEPTTVATDDIHDRSGNRLHGTCVNQPDRGMTGWNWTGTEEHFVHAPEQYGALWFHADSLDDCRWEPTSTWTVPEGLRSGAYALQVESGDSMDQIPFFISPSARSTPDARILLLLPTYSYVAYANTQVMQNAPVGQSVMGVLSVLEDIDLELHESSGEYGLSTYDYHLDGRGVSYSSWRRPILNMRPRYRHEFGSVWQFPADLHLIDWLDQLGLDYDVATDHDLADEGSDLLSRYNVVVTGTHPEYYSTGMLDAWEEYLATGGRGMYLAGNGFYWVATPHPSKPWLIEVRKGESGDQAWRARPGEMFHSTTGERGGLWRMRARAPQKLWGTGYGAHGLDRSTGYHQLPDARDSRSSWIFEGIGSEEVIGDFGLVNDGASGLEMDHIDYALGTPPNTQLLASSRGHSANAMIVPEDQFFSRAGMNGREDPMVRADLVYFTTRQGGAVFSSSSMAWCGSLSHNEYDNNVSTMTSNVLRRFASPEALPQLD
ncbi:MAG: hypothetical protein QOH68_370 [Nocardioidaceae bacterium]|jgi:N,N-dimethylformamidase|nr:hypothetical protein [Nocardioidaceae bacterium]